MVLVDFSLSPSHAPSRRLVMAVLLLAAAWIVGWACDRFPVPRWLRLSAVALLSLFAAWQIACFDSVKAPFSTHFLNLGSLSVPATACWVFVVAYSFFGTNLLPGLTLGLTAVISLTLFLVGILQPQSQGVLAQAIAIPLLGVSLGQLGSLRDKPLERLDSGTALAFGFAIALVTVLGALKNTAFLVLLLPVLVLGTPLLDVSYAFLRQSSSSAAEETSPVFIRRGKMRLHEVLLGEGVSPERVTHLLIAIDAYLCCLALVLVFAIRLHFLVKLALMLPFLGLGGFFFFALSRLFSRRTVLRPGEPVKLLDVSLTPVSMQEAMHKVEEFVASGKPHMIVTSDTSLLVRTQVDPEFFRIVNQADMVTADGIGVVLSARLLNLPIFERVSGCDMVAAMCELSARRGYRLFFLGAAPGIAERAVENLRQRYPQMVVAGVHHGYFPPEEEEAIVEMIRRARTDILFVALGIPKQEQFIHRNMERMQAAVCIGVGGSFDVYAGAVKRAPLWMQRLGLEWLYRTACQPRRIGRLWAIPRLLYLTLRHLRQKVNSTPNSSEGKLTV